MTFPVGWAVARPRSPCVPANLGRASRVAPRPVYGRRGYFATLGLDVGEGFQAAHACSKVVTFSQRLETAPSMSNRIEFTSISLLAVPLPDTRPHPTPAGVTP